MEQKIVRDLLWFYTTLSKGGKTAEFYEAQAPIIKDALEYISQFERKD